MQKIHKKIFAGPTSGECSEENEAKVESFEESNQGLFDFITLETIGKYQKYAERQK